MKISNMILLASLAISTNIFARGGDDTGNGENNFLNKSLVNQYTCLLFGGTVLSDGRIERKNFARKYFYYLDEEAPDPIVGSPMFVCHDFQLYGDIDSAEYPRLETIESFNLFNRFDVRMQISNNGKKIIDGMIEKNLLENYGINYQSDLFSQYSLSQNSYGYILRPFIDLDTNRVYCPSSDNINISPMEKVVMSYTGDTEGLYYGVKEKEIIGDDQRQQEVTATLYVTESQLLKYGFYFRDSTKTRVSDKSALEFKTVYFYYPFSDSMDPLLKGSRKLVTVRFPNGSTNTKKMGCVPKQ